MVSAETSLWHPFSNMAQARDGELIIDRGEDVWVWDEAGRRYLDGTASLWNVNIGHGRAEIHAAVQEQMAKLEYYHSFADFTNRPAVELAERLSGLAPVDDAKVFLGSGGGDAVDTAVKLAAAYWALRGRPGKNAIISRTSSYHGTHGFGTSIGGIEPNRVGWGPLLARSHRATHDSVEATAELIDRLGADSIAAIFVEPVIGAGGVIPPAEGYLEGIARLAREHEILLVIDSVICAFGRLGTWFGIERWDVAPDMILFAKGVTSGYLPLGGVIVSGEVAEPFWGGDGCLFRHGATYAGHPTCCAAALANLDVLEADGLIGRGSELEGVLLDSLTPLAEHPGVAQVRGGTGLLAAVEFTPEFLAALPGGVPGFTQAVRDSGVLVRALGSGVAVSPPLTVTDEHFGLISEAIAGTLDQLDRSVVAASSADF